MLGRGKRRSVELDYCCQRFTACATICVLVKARWVFVYGALLLLLATGAYAGGTYQRTKDGKTVVWNNYPRRGDAATWSGRRDAKGYATGYGTLTWYTKERAIVTGSNLPSPRHTVIGRYSGKMVRGKLNGPVVNVDPNGKTFHGTYAKGKKTRDWTVGLAPHPSSPREEPVQLADRTDIASNEAPHQGAVAEAPAEGPSSVQAPEVKSQEPEIIDRSANQPSSGSAVTETPRTDDSLRSLTNPPSSLRTNVFADASPQASIPSADLSSPDRPRLTLAEVIDLADAEARGQGYDLREYQRSEVHYSTAEDTWSVSYDQKFVDANGMAEAGKHFSISVGDKTKKASFMAGR
jgi:hypothetical protein